MKPEDIYNGLEYTTKEINRTFKIKVNGLFNGKKINTLVGVFGLIKLVGVEMERKYGEYVPESKKNNPKAIPPFHFFRGNVSATEILEMSKTFTDVVKGERTQHAQLTLFGFDLDISNGCSESCEAF